MRKLVSVLEAPLVLANCVSRFLNVNGILTAVDRSGRGRLSVLIRTTDFRRAERLLEKRGKSCGGDLRMGRRDKA